MKKRLFFVLGAVVAAVVLSAWPMQAASRSSTSARSSHDDSSVFDAARSATRALRDQGWSHVFGKGPTVVASGLNNPRQLSLATGDGVLLIAEAGKGGPGPCFTGEEGDTCLGATGRISAVFVPQFKHNARVLPVFTGLLSLASPDGSFAVGSDGVSGRTLSDIYVQETAAPPDVPLADLPVDQSGQLLHGGWLRGLTPVADIAGYEAANDPDHQGADSDPYAVLRVGDRVLVADAAGNDVLSVARDGTISTFAVFDNITTGLCAGIPNDAGTSGCDAVPTSLAVGPDGAIYVGGLGALTPGAGRVWKLDPKTGAIEQTWDNLTSVTGVAVGRDGTLYVSELMGASPDAPGDVVRISTDGARTTQTVPFAAGLAVDRWNNVYVSAYSTSPDTGLGIPGVDSSGQVWRLRF